MYLRMYDEDCDEKSTYLLYMYIQVHTVQYTTVQ